MVIGWVIGVVVVIALIFVYYYNRFVTLNNRTQNSLSQIDVQLKRRADLVPNLIETVKGYAKHEKSVIKEVTDARKALLSAGNLPAKMKAGAELQTALKSIFALAESYPALKANENFLELQRELSATEDKIAYSRQYYNDSILSYNNLCQSFPGNMFAKLYGRQVLEFLKITAEERVVPKVEF